MSSLNLLRCALQTAKQIKCVQTNNSSFRLYQANLNNARWMSTKRKGFVSELWENLKTEMDKDKEFKENMKKFQEDAKKLEQSESLLKAREKYKAIESETLKGSDAIKKRISDMQETVTQSKYAKKSVEMMEDVAETVSKQTETLSQTSVYKTISHGVQAVKQEIEETAATERSSLYKAPEKLRKRDEYSLKFGERPPVKADEETTNVVLSKSSQWSQSWQDFKNNNKMFEKIFDMKAKYDESDNLIVRATRAMTDRVSGLLGGVFHQTELSGVLTEIVKVDSTFDKDSFLKLCQFDIIPNILEAINKGDLEILKDWCHEGMFNLLSTPIKQAQAENLTWDNKVLDISHLDLLDGRILDHGPVLLINFVAQQIMVVRDRSGNVVEGNPDKIMRVQYVWVLCRDQDVYDPKAAWKLLEMQSNIAEQWV